MTMWLARLKPMAAVAAAIILVTAGVAVQGRPQPAPEGAREQAKSSAPQSAGAAPEIAANRALAKKQLALIDGALAALHGQAQNARTSFTDPSFSVWERRRLETLRKTGADKAQIIAALEKYIQSREREEEVAGVEAGRGAANKTMIDVLDARFRRMEAEIWLNEEKAR